MTTIFSTDGTAFSKCPSAWMYGEIPPRDVRWRAIQKMHAIFVKVRADFKEKPGEMAGGTTPFAFRSNTRRRWLSPSHLGTASRVRPADCCARKGPISRNATRRGCCGRHLPGHHPGGVRRFSLWVRTSNSRQCHTEKPRVPGPTVRSFRRDLPNQGPVWGRHRKHSRRPERCP